MRPCVIADGVSLVDHTADKLRRGLAVIVCYEENSFYVLFFQRVKYRRSVPVLIALVKGKADSAVRGKELPAERSILLLGFYRVNGTV